MFFHSLREQIRQLVREIIIIIFRLPIWIEFWIRIWTIWTRKVVQRAAKSSKIPIRAKIRRTRRSTWRRVRWIPETSRKWWVTRSIRRTIKTTFRWWTELRLLLSEIRIRVYQVSLFFNQCGYCDQFVVYFNFTKNGWAKRS